VTAATKVQMRMMGDNDVVLADHTVNDWTGSKNQVKKAGERLRQPVGDSDAEIASYLEAINIAERWRRAHSYVLTKGAMSLRSRCRTPGVANWEVSQRQKRLITIMDKLGRIPGIRLDRMQDIAGCRAIMDTVADVRKVQRQYHKTSRPEQIRNEKDYILTPKTSGYRGVHMIVAYRAKNGAIGPEDLLVEVQLRTRIQHEWATTVEKIAGKVAFDLKSSVGPPEVLKFLSLVAEAMAHEESGNVPPPVLLEDVRRARTAAGRFL